MQAPRIVTDAADVASILEGIDLTDAILRDSIYQAYLHRVRLTPNHPPSFHGLEMWGWAVASFREQAAQRGWVAINFGNYTVTIRERQEIAINIASGDEATGVDGHTPSTRSRKGPNTVDAVMANSQVDAFADLLPPDQRKPKVRARDFKTWLLLHYIDTSKKEIRIELSLPAAIDDDGWVTRWTQRLILKPISLDVDPIESESTLAVDPEIQIRRR